MVQLRLWSKMMDALSCACEMSTQVVQTITATVKYVVQLNYEAVSMVYGWIVPAIPFMFSTLSQIKQYITLIVLGILAFCFDIYTFVSSMFSFISDIVVQVPRSVQTCWVNVLTVSSLCNTFLFNCYTVVKMIVKGLSVCIYTGFATSVDMMSTVILVFTAVGKYCVSFVTGVWNGLGFVLSSVAYFPVFCIGCVDKAWDISVNTLYSAMTATPKETYLGIVVLCLLYLTLSNVMRYVHCRGLSLFPQRHRRQRRNIDWHIDPTFESDFEDLYSSDGDDRLWRNENRNSNLENEDEIPGGHNENESDNSDNDDEGENVDSDEDTVDTVDDSDDSEASINSQTFSTESSDHEIDVQLPPLEERSSFRSCSSTPSRVPQRVSSTVDFDREMERERDKRKCVVCQDTIKSVLVLPCRHMCMCIGCADQIVKSRMAGRRVCPLCRTKIQKVMNIYV